MTAARLAIGIDCVDIARLGRMATTPKFLDAAYTAREQKACAGQSRLLAIHWAAKEAVMKALGVGISQRLLLEIEVRARARGADALVLSGHAAGCAARVGVTQWALTTSATSAVAFAAVIGTGPSELPDRRTTMVQPWEEAHDRT